MGREADRVGKELEQGIELMIKRLSLDITHNLKRDTPRDTGWARNNWVPSVGVPFLGVAGSRDAPEGATSERGAAEVATQYRLSRGRVFISNNVPYIIRLNEGSSTQAPAKFVEAAIQEGIQGLDGVVLS